MKGVKNAEDGLRIAKSLTFAKRVTILHQTVAATQGAVGKVEDATSRYMQRSVARCLILELNGDPLMKIITAVVCIAILCGCGKSDESASKAAGTKVGEALTDFATGVGKGIDRQMQVNVVLSAEVAQQGLGKTVAKSLGIDTGRKCISVYFMAKTSFKGTLLAKAMNKEGQEIGRSAADVDFANDDAKYVSFEFEQEMDTQSVDTYVIEVKK